MPTLIVLTKRRDNKEKDRNTGPDKNFRI